jgi:hypothetical protein
MKNTYLPLERQLVCHSFAGSISPGFEHCAQRLTSDTFSSG